VINMWSAFRYFGLRSRTARAGRVARVLRPGGVFVIDAVNQMTLVRIQHQAWEELQDGAICSSADARPDDGAGHGQFGLRETGSGAGCQRPPPHTVAG
jgi:hypothetical protein